MKRWLYAVNRWGDQHWWTAIVLGTILSFVIAAALFGPRWGAAWTVGWFVTYSVVRLFERRRP